MKKRGAGQKEGEGQDKSGIVFKMRRIILRRTRRERNRDKKEEPVYDCVIYGFFFFLSGHVFASVRKVQRDVLRILSSECVIEIGRGIGGDLFDRPLTEMLFCITI